MNEQTNKWNTNEWTYFVKYGCNKCNIVVVVIVFGTYELLI